MRIRTLLFHALALGALCVITASFTRMPDNDPARQEAMEEPLEFVTDGLYNAEFFDYIFRGHFEHIELTREDMHFMLIFEEYLRTFGRQCPDNLPEDKVEIMKWVCVKEQVTTNGYGVEVSRVCIEWKQVGTGLYARPDLYQAKNEVENIQNANAFRTTMEIISDPNAMGNSVDMIHKTKGLNKDMASFFLLNACNSPGVRRFEENLKRFAQNKPSIRMEGASKYAAMKESGGPTGTQNLNKLCDDLVANQAKTWGFNRYQAGSISGVTILSTDAKGRPLAIKANYKYSGFGSSANGWTKITFKNGLPDCIYFFDFPNNCKTPGSSIVASYAKGDYGMN